MRKPQKIFKTNPGKKNFKNRNLLESTIMSIIEGSLKVAVIVKLETEQGMLEGHEACASYFDGKVQELLGFVTHTYNSINNLTIYRKTLYQT